MDFFGFVRGFFTVIEEFVEELVTQLDPSENFVVAFAYAVVAVCAWLAYTFVREAWESAGSIWSKIGVAFFVFAFFVTLLVTDGFKVSPCQRVELMALETVKSNQNNLLGAYGNLGLEFGAKLLGANLGDGTIAKLGAMEKYPNLPPQVGCSIGVYQIWLHS